MFLRPLRWALAVVVLVATTASSHAGVEVLIQEIDAGGNVVQTLPTIVAGNTNLFSTSTNSFGVAGSGILTGNGTFAALASSVTLTIGAGYVQADGHGLLVTVTGTDAANNFPGQPASVTNQASASNSLFGTGGSGNIAATSDVTGQTEVAGVVTPPSNAVAQVGPPVGGPLTQANVANLPNPYSIVQTILIKTIPLAGATLSVGATSTSGLNSTVTSNAAPEAVVPAPAGLVLALTALPALGLRRVLRRKPVA